MANAGLCSRREAKALVSDGKVLVNGEIASGTGIQIDPDRDIIEVAGKRILLADKSKIYILMNKLPGYLSTTADPQSRRTVMDLLPPLDQRVYPVGRLDMDTEGLLLFTNDGDLAYRLTHPSFHINKVYLAWVNGCPTEASLTKLRNGVMLDDGPTAPATVERVRGEEAVCGIPCTCIRITIHEGRKRQIKRMFAAVGHKVLRLKRVQIGSIQIGDLPPGKCRPLSSAEVEALRKDS